MTFRTWLINKINIASVTAEKGKYYDTRIKAAERKRIIELILTQLELSNLDLKHLYQPYTNPDKGNK